MATDLRSFRDVVIALFGPMLFQDASLYLERYRPILNSTSRDKEWVKKFIWAAFVVRILCRGDSNACTSASVLLSLPGFWALLSDTKRLRTLAAYARKTTGTKREHPCFDLKSL